MKQYLPILLPLALLKLLIQCLGNRHYGFHRDELLHLSVSEHPDWGYMEFPPLIAWLGKVTYWLFDYHLLGVRLLPTLAGVLMLLLCGEMARRMGGGAKAIGLAGVAVLAFLPFYRNHTLFQPVAFDQLFWTLGFYLMIRFLDRNDAKWLLALGCCAGLGLLNKYTMIVWIFAMLVGLLFYQKGRVYKNKMLYLSGLLTLLIFLPNLLWQFQHGLPFFNHLQELQESQLSQIQPFQFVLDQLAFPFTLLLSLIGLQGFWRDPALKSFRSIGISAVVLFLSMWLMQAKSYYIFGIYPLLFAAGAVVVERFLASRKKWLFYAFSALLILPSIPAIPMLTPILPIETFVAYSGLEEKDGRVELTGDYADMFGWEEQVQLVDSVYRSLSVAERDNCVLWAENYGEAGALKVLGKQYGLPDPISRHGSFWMWGYGNKSAEVWISLGNEKPSVEYAFEEVRLVKTIRHRYAIGEENNIPLYLCRKPRIDIEQWWRDYEAYIFD